MAGNDSLIPDPARGAAVLSPVPGAPRPPGPESIPTPEGGGSIEALLAECVWTDETVGAAGVPVVDVPLVTAGGGFGSFALVNLLRIAGVRSEDIAVLTQSEEPFDTFKAMAEASQMGEDDLLRSDSASRMGNIWGFPGYAVEEAVRRRTLRPLGRVLAEPVLAEYYNPRCHQLYEGIRREAERIGWRDMLARGRVLVVRRRAGGGYFALLATDPRDSSSPHVAYRCDYVHIALGYPSLRLLPDFAEYRQRHRDPFGMVHVYEPHDHVYETLLHQRGTVLLRGAGIAASRVLERLIVDRDHGAQTQIVHLFRHYIASPSGPPWFRRPGRDGFIYQPFNFPKGAFGGQLAGKVASLEPRDRARFLKWIGASTTPPRRVWLKQLERGRREGWYRVHVGKVIEVLPTEDGRVRTRIQGPTRPLSTIDVDFVIDATGLTDDVRGHPVIADLFHCGGAAANALGRLDVDHHFEVRGTRNGGGRLYASGSITLGGPVAPVDSFFGLTQAGIAIADDLARQGFCARIGTRRSIAAWWGWVRNLPL